MTTGVLVRWLEKAPLIPLVLVVVLLTFAPFMPEPHLWEKLKMLAAGELSKPLDILDLLMHSVPLALLAAKLVLRRRQQRSL